MRSVMLVSDIMLIPTKASRADLELLEHMAETVEMSREYNPDLKVGVFINMIPTNSQVEKITAKKLLKEFLEFKVMSTTISDRKVYRDSFSSAKGVHEWKDSKAKSELSCLLQKVVNVIR